MTASQPAARAAVRQFGRNSPSTAVNFVGSIGSAWATTEFGAPSRSRRRQTKLCSAAGWSGMRVKMLAVVSPKPSSRGESRMRPWRPSLCVDTPRYRRLRRPPASGKMGDYDAISIC